MDGYIKKSEAVDVIVKYPYDIAGKTATAIKMIEDLPSADIVPKSEVESIITLNSQLEAQVFEQRKEVNRLHDILLQFTDIVHKWGAKNNIDTSEISLVPIMYEEADSIIQKANQEFASEIFKEIDLICVDVLGEFNFYRYNNLKKKYTEGEQ